MPTGSPAPIVEEITGVHGRLWTAHWPPAASPPRAAILLVHGYAEHTGRYDHVISALTRAGYTVYALDHHGHGRSAGRRSACRRFDDYVDDAETLLGRVLAQHPDLPVVLYGHSMGGLIATRLALRRQPDLAGLIATSAAYRVGDDTAPILRAVAPLIARLLPDLPVVAPTPAGILSRDPAIDARVAADPLCYQGRTRAGLAYAMLTAGQETRARAAELTLPLLIMHGVADQLTNPAGSQEVHDCARSPDKTLRLWPDNRHELHNDLDQTDVIAAILAWLDAHTGVRE
jgi:acylglycerol lipase